MLLKLKFKNNNIKTFKKIILYSYYMYMSDNSSENSEENKFTPEKIAEKKTRPYLQVELFDKNINNIKDMHSMKSVMMKTM